MVSAPLIKRSLAAFVDFWVIITLIFFINWAHSYLDNLAMFMAKSPLVDSPVNNAAFQRSKAADYYAILFIIPFIYYAALILGKKATLGQKLLNIKTVPYGKKRVELKISMRAALHGILICPMVVVAYAFLISLPEGSGPFVEIQSSLSTIILLLAPHIPFRGTSFVDKLTLTRVVES